MLRSVVVVERAQAVEPESHGQRWPIEHAHCEEAQAEGRPRSAVKTRIGLWQQRQQPPELEKGQRNIGHLGYAGEEEE